MTELEMTAREVHQLLEAQKQYFSTLETRSVDFRIRQLKVLKATIKQYEAEVMAALAEDLGKSPVEAYATEIGFISVARTSVFSHGMNCSSVLGLKA